MDDTGRLRAPVGEEARRLVYGSMSDGTAKTVLRHMLEIDCAHVVMLYEQRILPLGTVEVLLVAFSELLAADFAQLVGRTTSRGLYFLYEDFLIDQLGIQVGGALHLGRSRNDVNATVSKLRLRKDYIAVLGEGLRLADSISNQSRAFPEVLMPAYTHGQAAVPITLAHYLSAVALALSRDLEWLADAFDDIDISPLGAGAVGGTTVPIDQERTTELLGFKHPAVNSVDAVASRDVFLRVLGAATVSAVTVSRLVHDLSTWASGEYGFLQFPDDAVGSSSMMPQKRNPFLLEHITGRGAFALGAFAAASGAMYGTPYTNSIAVGTEAMDNVWPALERLKDVYVLARIMIDAMIPDKEAMLSRAEESYTVATAMAEALALSGRLSLREAHHLVGMAVSRSIADGSDLSTVVRELLRDRAIELGDLPSDVGAALRAARYGGSASTDVLDASLAIVAQRQDRISKAVAERRRSWEVARQALASVVSRTAGCSIAFGTQG